MWTGFFPMNNPAPPLLWQTDWAIWGGYRYEALPPGAFSIPRRRAQPTPPVVTHPSIHRTLERRRRQLRTWGKLLRFASFLLLTSCTFLVFFPLFPLFRFGSIVGLVLSSLALQVIRSPHRNSIRAFIAGFICAIVILGLLDGLSLRSFYSESNQESISARCRDLDDNQACDEYYHSQLTLVLVPLVVHAVSLLLIFFTGLGFSLSFQRVSQLEEGLPPHILQLIGSGASDHEAITEGNWFHPHSLLLDLSSFCTGRKPPPLTSIGTLGDKSLMVQAELFAVPFVRTGPGQGRMALVPIYSGPPPPPSVPLVWDGDQRTPGCDPTSRDALGHSASSSVEAVALRQALTHSQGWPSSDPLLPDYPQLYGSYD